MRLIKALSHIRTLPRIQPITIVCNYSICIDNYTEIVFLEKNNLLKNLFKKRKYIRQVHKKDIEYINK